MQSSFSDIARVLSEFFRDLDVVPTDVIVGLVLLRHRQQLIRMRVVDLVSQGNPNNECLLLASKFTICDNCNPHVTIST